MDEFGMGSAAMAGLAVYAQSGRGSGRSTRLIRRLVANATVWCISQDEAYHLSREIMRLRPEIAEYVACRVGRPREFPGYNGVSPAFFTEQFVERAYRAALERISEAFGDHDRYPELPPHVPRPINGPREREEWMNR